MNFESSYLYDGVQAARKRCERSIEGLIISNNTLDNAYALVEQALKRESAQWHPRAITLFSELLAMGAICRAYYGEPEITPTEADLHVKNIAYLFNSFTHK